MKMATKTTINFDDEMKADLAELVATDGAKTLAIKPALISEAKRRRSRALLDFIDGWEADDGPIDTDHMEWAHRVLDRQGAPR